MKLFRRSTPLTREQLITSGYPPEVADWQLSRPSPGEVFVYTGLASAEDCRKLRADYDQMTNDRLLSGMRYLVEECIADAAWREAHPEEAAAKDAAITLGVRELLESVGLDPDRFCPIEPQISS